MELAQWFLMGILFTLSVFGLTYLSLLAKLKWYTWACLIAGLSLVLFGFGWAWASFLEGVEQSGAMGLVFFSGGGLIVLVLTWRFLVAPELNRPRRES